MRPEVRCPHALRAGLRAAPILLSLAIAAPPRSVAAQGASTAQPSKAARDEAASRFKKGIELFKEADYQAALVEFRRAYELVPSWQVLYNIGQVQYQLQDYAGALATLERYLSEGGKQVPAARRTEVERDIQTLKGRIAFVEITVNVPDAEIAVDDEPVATAPLSKPLTVSAGRRRVSVSREGYAPQSKVVEVASGDTAKLDFKLIERGAGAPASPAPGPGAGRDGKDQATPEEAGPRSASEAGGSGSGVPWIGWGVTGGLAAGAVVFGALALGASSELGDLKETRGVSPEDLDAASSKATTFAVVTDVLAGAAIVAGGISLYLTLRSPPSDGEGGERGAQAKTRPLRLGIGPGRIQVSGSF